MWDDECSMLSRKSSKYGQKITLSEIDQRKQHVLCVKVKLVGKDQFQIKNLGSGNKKTNY